MDTCTIGVTWVPRPDEVIHTTAFTWSGAKFRIYPDGHHFPFQHEDEVVNLGAQVGCFRHYYRVLKDLFMNTSTPFVGIIPDDMRLMDGAVQSACDAASAKGIGYAAMYTPAGMAAMSHRLRLGTQGWYEIKGGWGKSWGGCYVFSRAVAERLIYHPFILSHHATYGKNQQIDHAIPEACHRMGLKQLMHKPSLCEHVGMTSTIGHVHSKREDALK